MFYSFLGIICAETDGMFCMFRAFGYFLSIIKFDFSYKLWILVLATPDYTSYLLPQAN